MSPMDQNNQEAREPVDRDLLISRVVDDAASAQDWQQLRALAEYDPSVWRELFEAQHAQAELAQAVQQAIAIADGIDAPTQDLGGPNFRFRFRQAATWAGWAVAASVAVIWVAPHIGTPQATPVSGNQATLVPEFIQGGPSSEELTGFEAYRTPSGSRLGELASPRSMTTEPFRQASTNQQNNALATNTEHLAEMPDRELLEIRPLPNGQLEVIYVRRLIEKAVVDEGDLYQVKPDDAGIDRAVPYRQRRPSSGPI